MNYSIPLMDLKKQYLSIKPEIDQAITQILETTTFVGGPEKDLFEKEYAALHKSEMCIGVGNGTDSLFLSFKALGLGAGDEIATAANSFIASSEAISACGAKPVFVDIDEKTSNINLNLVEQLFQKKSPKVGGRLKAILPVHLYGRMVDMPRLMQLANHYQVQVVEDAAQAHLAEIDGKKAGTWGKVGSFSFYPGKNLGAYGDAGAIITDDAELGTLIKKLANHGRTKKYDHDMEGFNSRLDSLQAAVLRVKLKHLPHWTKLRQQKAKVYDQLLANMEWVKRPTPNVDKEHVYHLYVVQVPKRDQVLESLKSQGIEASIHYPIMLPQLEAYTKQGYNPSDYPVAGRIQNEILSLPLYPEISEEDQNRVVKALQKLS
jgi:dTDP-4-amino-4,6-dideoxygalactose transaminase